jgi:hypothetical protein
MKKQKAHFLFKLSVVVFLVGYVLGSFTNMLIIPRYVPEFSVAAQSPAGSFCCRSRLTDLQSINPVKIFDRSTIENSTAEKLGLVPKSLVLLYDARTPLAKEAGFTTPQNHTLYKSRYIYLSLCTFRI